MIQSEYTYKNNTLVDNKGNTVMMEWERPIMKKVAEILTENKGDVLNIGFGMGIVDGYIRDLEPKSHTVIENHPDVIKHVKENKWDESITFIYGRWQDNIESMGEFDSIYLDTWIDYRTTHIPDLLDKCLRVGGVFSIWHNHIEFNEIIHLLDDRYTVDYVYIYNDSLIPTKQYERGGGYIDPKLDKVTIPIITKIR